MGVKMSPSSIMAPDLVTNCPWRGSARQARKPILSRISHSLQPAFLLSAYCSILPLLWAFMYHFSFAQYGGTVLRALSPIWFWTNMHCIERQKQDRRGRYTQGEKQMLLSNWREPITMITVKSQAVDGQLYLSACKKKEKKREWNLVSKHAQVKQTFTLSIMVAMCHDFSYFMSLSNSESTTTNVLIYFAIFSV